MATTQPVVVRRAPPNPPLAFESAPVLFPAEEPVGVALAALALLALFAASASHLGLLFVMWRRVPA